MAFVLILFAFVFFFLRMYVRWMKIFGRGRKTGTGSRWAPCHFFHFIYCAHIFYSNFFIFICFILARSFACLMRIIPESSQAVISFTSISVDACLLSSIQQPIMLQRFNEKSFLRRNFIYPQKKKKKKFTSSHLNDP